MIGRLRGPLLEVGDEEALIEAGGVGYVVKCGVRTLAAMPKTDTEVILHIDSQTREDGTRLYGFLNKDERQAFQALLGVQGVGPKAALSVLDVLTPVQLAQAVAQDDKASVGRANGVGPKLALRITVELKGKALTTAIFEPMAARAAEPLKATVNGESVAALIGLGISEMQARLAVESALRDLGPDLNSDAALPLVIRTALKHLGK